MTLDAALVSAPSVNAKVTDCGDYIRIDSPTGVEWRHKVVYPAALRVDADAVTAEMKRRSVVYAALHDGKD